MFTIKDFGKGYYQVELDEVNSFLITFNILKMPFGLAIAGDVFQHKLYTILYNPDLCTSTADDMVMDEEADRSDHDRHLTEFLQITRQYNHN